MRFVITVQVACCLPSRKDHKEQWQAIHIVMSEWLPVSTVPQTICAGEGHHGILHSICCFLGGTWWIIRGHIQWHKYLVLMDTCHTSLCRVCRDQYPFNWIPHIFSYNHRLHYTTDIRQGYTKCISCVFTSSVYLRYKLHGQSKFLHARWHISEPATKKHRPYYNFKA